jgi:hypothetical protein
MSCPDRWSQGKDVDVSICMDRDPCNSADYRRYTIYRATVDIVAHHYRPYLGSDELEARRQLSLALHELAAM